MNPEIGLQALAISREFQSLTGGTKAALDRIAKLPPERQLGELMKRISEFGPVAKRANDLL